jgi:hypothetical protein
MKRIFTFTTLILIAVLGLALSSSAQIKKRQPAKKKPVKTAQTETTQPAQASENAETKTPEKKNERPQVVSADYETNALQESQPQKKNQAPKSQKPVPVAAKESKNVFAYEFSQPDFVVSRIAINHDENGKGTITFEKKGFGGEAITDPIQLSEPVVEKIKNLFQTLNFLDSTEEYQSTLRQYPHLGTMKIRLKKDGRERASEFNWTENQTAKALADEYQKIGEQFVWMFDITVSLENQPLEAPRLMTKLDMMVKRNWISDPSQMIPLLKKLSDDERIPLIARNHATRIVREIEKNARK